MMPLTLPFAWLLLFAGAFALINWYAAGRGLRWLIYFSKPGTMIVLLVWFALTAPLAGSGGRPENLFFLLGGACGLAGDVALMLPTVRFKLGLGAFLAGHICYIIALNLTLPDLHPTSVLFGLGLIVIGGVFYSRLAGSLVAKKLRRMRLPVLFYVLAILPMTWSAMQTIWRPEWQGLPALLAASGGLLFLVSDGLLAWDRFVKPIPFARSLVMITYHLAQFGILVGAGL